MELMQVKLTDCEKEKPQKREYDKKSPLMGISACKQGPVANAHGMHAWQGPIAPPSGTWPTQQPYRRRLVSFPSPDSSSPT